MACNRKRATFIPCRPLSRRSLGISARGRRRTQAAGSSRRRTYSNRDTPYNPTMLLTITTTHRPATDLGYLLHKNPAKVHSFDLSFGKAHVFYPEATAAKCTVALLMDVDPVGLV